MKLALFALVLASFPAFGQNSTSDSPLVSTLAKHLQVSRDYTLAIAAQMPAGDYGFKPVPAEMSFGQQMNHIATAISMFSAAVGAPQRHYTDTSKAAVAQSLAQAFDDAIAAVSKMDDAGLHKSLKTPEGEGSALDGLLLLLDHTTHHRGQCIVYLRLKGITPTEYRY